MPQWVARLPNDVGYAAGGSLTADEWKGMALNYCPIIVPLIWDEWQPSAEATYEKRMKKWQADDTARLRCISKGKRRADGTKEPRAPKPERRMHPEDADNFLSLAAALKVIMGRSVNVTELPRACKLLQDYLINFLKVRLIYNLG
ncbi:hypothetical protein SCP_0606170 [Sparassis crispa]|uniref:Uncharacterized protein n=1 Tax=Sparassis crispa TaxID=139825 RepID=A0A401GQX8_9APHY|nr:hypothetical protein SCP_0606170 [Sparassis crispa]GBE84638.1 hypothetical protein SCP_0606170 [Sparassis crispa]